ncbi:MAG: nucleotidyltransferase domain-containing protein [Marinobacter sp.]|uniref:nucleotidyltransferase domain-containing protein n=1 Tax=Marinobacter sp. TaxID=50741 RepID=UPI0034A047FB
MTGPKDYSLEELIAQCDPDAPISTELRVWDQAPAVGLEKDVKRLRGIVSSKRVVSIEEMNSVIRQKVMDSQTDLSETFLKFSELASEQFEVIRLVLFGSRARGDYKPDSDTDVAVILRGEPGDFVETKLAMASIADDVLLETGVRIHPFPVWESEWRQPERYSNPDILNNIAHEGIIIWQA